MDPTTLLKIYTETILPICDFGCIYGDPVRRRTLIVLGVLRFLPASYIGETGRNLSIRLTEHNRATRNGDVNNHIAEHHLKTKHPIDWDSATCITYSTDYYQRLALESWFTNLELFKQ